MPTQQLYIPSKLKIGFQNRADTYTGKLAFVVYYDMKGELRKERSWEGWRDNKIDPIELDNVPTEGFVLNKKVGGHRSHWNYRDAHVRVYDPRNFEFEISVPNLLFILTQCDCSRGKGIEGKFVYAWEGTELVLLPERSEEYANSQKFTVLQAQTVKAKELVPGASYVTKKQDCITYIGKFDYYLVKSYSYRKKEKPYSKKHVFWNSAKKHFIPLDDLKILAATAQLDATPDLAELTQLHYKGPHGSPIKELFTKPIPEDERRSSGWFDEFCWVYEETPGVYVECQNRYNEHTVGPSDPDKISQMDARYKYVLKDGILEAESFYRSAYKKGNNRYNYSDYNTISYVEPTYIALWARLESGEEYLIRSAGLQENKHG